MSSVDEYLERQPDAARAVLERIREVVRKALPRAQEELSYGLPTYRQGGAPVLYFAGWKHHVALYPASRALVAAFGAELEPYRAEKGTLRFALNEPVPLGLISRIAKFREAEVSGGRRPPRRKPATRRVASR